MKIGVNQRTNQAIQKAKNRIAVKIQTNKKAILKGVDPIGKEVVKGSYMLRDRQYWLKIMLPRILRSCLRKLTKIESISIEY